jgi:DNA primase
VNFLLPHVQRVPNRIARDEISQEIAQKLGIDSTVLRQELRHVAVQRSASTVKAPAQAQVTDAERILVRALASARQMQPEAEHFSNLDGARDFTKEEEFDPARQAQYAFQSEALHRGLATESLVEALLSAGAEVADVMEVPCSDFERRMLATILLNEEEELSAERLEGAVRALRRIHLRRRLDQTQQELKRPGLSDDKVRMKELLLEMERLSRALRDPSLAEDGLKRTG